MLELIHVIYLSVVTMEFLFGWLILFLLYILSTPAREFFTKDILKFYKDLILSTYKKCNIIGIILFSICMILCIPAVISFFIILLLWEIVYLTLKLLVKISKR